MLKVTFINNSGAGFAKEVEVEDGTSIEAFLLRQLGSDFNEKNFTIRVNGKTPTRNAVLGEGDDVSAQEAGGTPMDSPLSAGDKVTVSPSNIKGA